MISAVRIILHASIFLVFTYELVKVKEDFFPQSVRLIPDRVLYCCSNEAFQICNWDSWG
jgi:hypothetical protein